MVTFTAYVRPTNGNGIPTGTISFLMDGSTTPFASATLRFGQAAVKTSTLTAGSHTITAVYSGDSKFATSTSKVLKQLIDIDTNTTLTSVPNPSNSGQTVTFTARVNVKSSPKGAVTEGIVIFYDGSNSIGSVDLSSVSNGTAVLSCSSLPVGSQNIRAVYSGSKIYKDSESNTIKQIVNQTTPSKTIKVISPNGGESRTTGSSLNITWTSTGINGHVKIELSRNGGSTWTTINSNADNDGNWNWTVSGSATTEGRVRITRA